MPNPYTTQYYDRESGTPKTAPAQLWVMNGNTLLISGKGTKLEAGFHYYGSQALTISNTLNYKDSTATINVFDGAILTAESYIDVGGSTSSYYGYGNGQLIVKDAYVLVNWNNDGQFQGKGMLALGNHRNGRDEGRGQGVVEISGKSFVFADKGIKFAGDITKKSRLILNGGQLVTDVYRAVGAGRYGRDSDISIRDQMGDQGYTTISNDTPSAISPAHFAFSGGTLILNNKTTAQPSLLFNNFYTLTAPAAYSITVNDNDAKLILDPTLKDKKALVQYPHAAITPIGKGGLVLEKEDTNNYTGDLIQGGGTLVLTADNRYQGNTTVEAGILEIGGEGYVSLALSFDGSKINRSYRVEDLDSLQEQIKLLPEAEQKPYYFGETGDIGEGDVYLGTDDSRAILKITRSNEYTLDNGVHGNGDFYQSGSGETILNNLGLK